MTVLGILALIGAAISAFFFRPGGIYNPHPEPVEGPQNPVPPPVVPDSPPAPKTPTVSDLCLAIRDFEGKPGDRNYKNNNPGNCRYSHIGYLPMYEPVGKDKDGFAVFKDYATGWLYLNNYVKYVIHEHPNLTLLTFIGGEGDWSGYSPASDGNPVTAYATFLANRLHVNTGFQLKNLVVG